MELFPKQIVNDLNPLQGLGHFLECKSPFREKNIFAAIVNDVLNFFYQNL